MSSSEQQEKLKMEYPVHQSPQTPTKDDTLDPKNETKKPLLWDLAQAVARIFCYPSSYLFLLLLRPFGFSTLELMYFGLHIMLVPSGHWVYKWTSRKKDGDYKLEKPPRDVSKEEKKNLGKRACCFRATLSVGLFAIFFIIGFAIVFLDAFIVAALYTIVFLPHSFENLIQALPSTAFKIIGLIFPVITKIKQEVDCRPLTCHCDCACYTRSTTGLKVEEALCQLDKFSSLSELSTLQRVELFIAINLLIVGVKYGILRLEGYMEERKSRKGNFVLEEYNNLEGKAMLE